MLNTFSNNEQNQKRRSQRQIHMTSMSNATKFNQLLFEDTNTYKASRNNWNVNDDRLFENMNLQNLSKFDIAHLEICSKDLNPNMSQNFTFLDLRKIRKKSRFVFISATVLIILGFTLSLKTKKLNAGQKEFSWDGTEAKTIREWIIDIGLSSQDDLMNPNSYQHKALKWMVEEDEVTMKGTIKSERYVLVVFFMSTTNWRVTDNWMSQESVCKWWGIECSLNEETILGINLTNNSIQGTLPSEIVSLGNLQLLDIGSNKLSGTIPERIGNLINIGKCKYQRNVFCNRNSRPSNTIDEINNSLHLRKPPS